MRQRSVFGVLLYLRQYAASDKILYVSRVCFGAAVLRNAGRSFLNRKSKKSSLKALNAGTNVESGYHRFSYLCRSGAPRGAEYISR